MRAQPVDKTSKRFVEAVVLYIAGIYNPECRITIEQAAIAANCSPGVMRTHLKKINAPIRKRTDPVNIHKKWQPPADMWKAKA